MHENREISSTPSGKCEGRSEKAINRTTDMHVLEKSDCIVVPVNQPNKVAQAAAEVGEGRVQLEENIGQTHMLLTLCRNYACPSARTMCVEQTAVPGFVFALFILQKSRMRRRARTDLCGGRLVRVVPTATVTGDGNQVSRLPVIRPWFRLNIAGFRELVTMPILSHRIGLCCKSIGIHNGLPSLQSHQA